MPRIILIATLLLVALVAAWFGSSSSLEWERRIADAVDEPNCPEATPRTYPEGSYAGPLIDAHLHIPSIPDGPPDEIFGIADADGRPVLGVNVTLSDIACQLAAEGTVSALSFFPVWPELSEPMVEVARRAVDTYPGAFVPFIMPPEHDDDPNGWPTVDADTLTAMLTLAPGLFDGYGEIGLYARDGGSPELPPNDPRLLAVYPVIEREGMGAYFHLGVGQQEAFEEVLDLYPNISFIFHGDQLIVYENDGQDLSIIEHILSSHPNAHYGIDELYGDVWLLRPEVSRDDFLSHFEKWDKLLEQDLDTWKGFIERHPDQVMWGTDRGWSAAWSLDHDVGFTLTAYARAFIGRLDPSVQEAFAYGNAARVAGVEK